MDRPRHPFWRNRPVAVGTVLIGLALALFLAAKVIHVLLLVFAGILFGIFLSTIAGWLAQRTRLSYMWSLAAAVSGLTGLFVLVILLGYGPLAGQAKGLAEQIPEAIDKVQSTLKDAIPGGAPSLGDMMSRAGTVVSGVFDFIVAFVVIFFVGIYVAADPDLYRRGMVGLAPQDRRKRLEEVLSTTGGALRRWLMARIVLMVFNGVLTTVGLLILGVPLALILGVIAGLLNFVPNIGPWVAAVPAILIALLKSPMTALWVALLYLVIQMLDGYVFTPLAEQRAVSLPPALIIVFQVAMGTLLGALGLLLATPIAAALLVIIKMLYVDDVLGEPAEIRGQRV